MTTYPSLLQLHDHLCVLVTATWPLTRPCYSYMTTYPSLLQLHDHLPVLVTATWPLTRPCYSYMTTYPYLLQLHDHLPVLVIATWPLTRPCYSYMTTYPSLLQLHDHLPVFVTVTLDNCTFWPSLPLTNKMFDNLGSYIEEHFTTYFWKSTYLHWKRPILCIYKRNEPLWNFKF